MRLILVVLLTICSMITSQVSASPPSYTIEVPVIEVTPNIKQVVESIPYRDCQPVVVEYNRPRSQTNTILGGIIGAAIGNELGHSKRNEQVGAVAGGMLGASIGRDATRGSTIYRTEQRCNTRYRTTYHDQVHGYNVRYRYENREYNTIRMHHPGKTIRLHISIMPE